MVKKGWILVVVYSECTVGLAAEWTFLALSSSSTAQYSTVHMALKY